MPSCIAKLLRFTHFFSQCITYVQFLCSSGCSSDQPQSMEPMPSGGSPSLQGDLWLRNQSAEAACPALTQLHPLKGDVALFLPIHLSVDHRESLESVGCWKFSLPFQCTLLLLQLFVSLTPVNSREQQLLVFMCICGHRPSAQMILGTWGRESPSTCSHTEQCLTGPSTDKGHHTVITGTSHRVTEKLS